MELSRAARARRPVMRFAAASLLLLATQTALATPRPVTVDDLMRLRSIGDVRLSPDGTRVAYTVSQPSFDQDEHETALYLVPAAGGEPVRLETPRLFNRPRPNPRLRWKPGGSSLSFVGFHNELPQVFVLDPRGGEARAVTTAPQGVADYSWSPGGEAIAYLAPDPPSADEERRRKDKTFVIEVDRQDKPARIWVQELAGGAARPVSPPQHFVAALDWTPDGESIVYSAALVPGFAGQFNGRIYAVSLNGGEPRTIVGRDGMNASPQVSPDGRWVAFISSAGRAEMVSTWGLHLVSVGGGEVRPLAADTWVHEFTWAPDSRSLVVVPLEGPEQRGARMFEQPVLRLGIDGRREEVLAGRAVHYSPTLSRDGRRLAYRVVEPTTTGDVYVRDDGGVPRRLTAANPELGDLAMADQRPIHWTSSDGMEIWGLLVLPPGASSARLPLIVYAHGGPMGGFTYGAFPQFMHGIGQVDPYPVQAMASAGFALLLPMPRGGSGYGEAGFQMIKNAWGEDDYQDIMTGVDHLIRTGVADPDRLGVMGASYGGYMTDWIVTQTGRFKAASVMCSISDLADMYYGSDAGEPMREYFGLPWESAESYARHSPITHVARVTTPLLIQHGENDRRIPIIQATKFYRALKAMGKTVEMEIYPRGGHVIYEPDLQREIMQRNLEWFRRWLKP